MARTWHSPITELLLTLIAGLTLCVWVVVFLSGNLGSFLLACGLLGVQCLVLRSADLQRYRRLYRDKSEQSRELVFMTGLSALVVRAGAVIWADPGATWYIGAIAATVVMAVLCIGTLAWMLERTMWGYPLAHSIVRP